MAQRRSGASPNRWRRVTLQDWHVYCGAQSGMNAETDTQAESAPPSRARTAGEADRELITLYEISKILSSSLDFARSERAVLNVLLSYLDMHHGVVSMVHQSEQLHIVGALDDVNVGGVDAILEVEKGVS